MKLFGIAIKDDKTEALDKAIQEHRDLCAQATDMIENVGLKVAHFLKDKTRYKNDRG